VDLNLDRKTQAEITAAFIAVVKVKFRQRGVSPKGISKVDRREFVVRAGQEKLSLNRKWQAMYRPGQTVTMSMIFRPERYIAGLECPGCHIKFDGNQSGEIEWYNTASCGSCS
jgi:hypothetical protein